MGTPSYSSILLGPAVFFFSQRNIGKRAGFCCIVTGSKDIRNDANATLTKTQNLFHLSTNVLMNEPKQPRPAEKQAFCGETSLTDRLAVLIEGRSEVKNGSTFRLIL